MAWSPGVRLPPVAPRLRLYENWLRILKRSWSIRCISIAALLQGGEVVMSLWQIRLPFPPWWFIALSAAVTTAAIFARLLYQGNLGDHP